MEQSSGLSCKDPMECPSAVDCFFCMQLKCGEEDRLPANGRSLPRRNENRPRLFELQRRDSNRQLGVSIPFQRGILGDANADGM